MPGLYDPSRLDVAAFAAAAGTLSGDQPLSSFTRLAQESADAAEDAAVRWSATGARRADAAGAAATWLHLNASAQLPMVCQRCLSVMAVELTVDRDFRFVRDEATAAALDEDAEEDVLVLDRAFDLLALVEDELLMEVPVAPRHDRCPRPVVMSAADRDFDTAAQETPHPFAALERLRKPGG